MMQKEYKLTAPDMNRLIGCFSHEIQNPEQPSVALAETLDPLFKARFACNFPRKLLYHVKP